MDNELILTIYVQCLEATSVKGHTMDIVSVPFTGKAESRYFSGSTACTGTDTQKIYRDGKTVLSARYILEGTDLTGTRCRIFIENESLPDGTLRPSVVTDSEALADWETASLRAHAEPADDGVIIRIFRGTE